MADDFALWAGTTSKMVAGRGAWSNPTALSPTLSDVQHNTSDQTAGEGRPDWADACTAELKHQHHASWPPLHASSAGHTLLNILDTLLTGGYVSTQDLSHARNALLRGGSDVWRPLDLHWSQVSGEDVEVKQALARMLGADAPSAPVPDQVDSAAEEQRWSHKAAQQSQPQERWHRVVSVPAQHQSCSETLGPMDVLRPVRTDQEAHPQQPCSGPVDLAPAVLMGRASLAVGCAKLAAAQQHDCRAAYSSRHALTVSQEDTPQALMLPEPTGMGAAGGTPGANAAAACRSWLEPLFAALSTFCGVPIKFPASTNGPHSRITP